VRQDQQVRHGFDERLLDELKRIVTEDLLEESAAMPAARRPRWGRRIGVTLGLAAAFAVAIVAVVPTLGGEEGGPPAYAVTQNGDGSVTVEIRSIEEDAGLEAQLEAAGVPAAVHYLPAGKVCALPKPPSELEVLPQEARNQAHVAIATSDDGAFTFTVDPSAVPPGWTFVVLTQYSAPEHGQPGPVVPSIAAHWAKGDFDTCELVDGSTEGWTFQEGAVPGDKG
jgi:hypothetical protein